MVAQATCPDPDVIHDLLCGALPESEHDQLSSHFDLCSDCRRRFEDEASGPDFLGDVSRLCGNPMWQQETATLGRLMEDMPQQLSTAADAASAATWSAEAVSEHFEPSDNPDHIGRLGAYEIIEVVGRGGMGIVLRGIDTKLNRVVAIKVLAPELASNPNARRRFFREGQAAAAVSHDHVVTIHAVDDSERLPYLVMEYVEGESLEGCVRRTGSLSVEQILRIGRQTALGLAAAHEVGLVHRDMKPANILLENGIQRVRITDFGLARAVDDVGMTQTGTVSGTPLYMSPEQADGRNVDHRSDLFSLGSVLYTMCTGRPAFRANSTVAVLKRVCEDTPRPIREVNPDIPEWLAEIVDRLISKEPADRMDSAAEVAELLGAHLAHLQDPDNVPAPAGSTARDTESRRRPRRLLLLAALLSIVTFGVTDIVGLTAVGESFMGIILKLTTSDGTLVVEIEDPHVRVAVDGKELVVKGVGAHEIRLTPGQHRFTTIREGVAANQEWVTIESGGKTMLRVKLLPPEQPQAASSAATNPGSESSIDADFRPLRIVDGVAFETDVRLHRIGSDFIVVAMPLGKLVFQDVPEQLWGQRCAMAEVEDGVLSIKAMPAPVEGESLPGAARQRLWLLVPEKGFGGGEAPDDFGFHDREALAKLGWNHWRTLSSYHATRDPNVPENQVKWIAFYRDTGPGESFRIRTHRNHTPMLVWGSLGMGDVEVARQWDQRVSVFRPGASIPLGNGYHYFDEVPDILESRLYTKRNGYQGATHFRVEKDQRVYVAFYDWRHMMDGNASGGWHEELTPPSKLKQMGWQEVATMQGRHSNPEYKPVTWHVYTRNCKRGETFLLRGHKYQAPIVFAELNRDVSRPVFEGVDISESDEPVASTQNGPGIRLPIDRIVTKIAPSVGVSAVYGMSMPVAPIREFGVLFQARAEGRHSDGATQFIGQIKAGALPGDSVTVRSLERTGSEIRLRLSLEKGEQRDGNVNAASLFEDMDLLDEVRDLTVQLEEARIAQPEQEHVEHWLLIIARHMIARAEMETDAATVQKLREQALERVTNAHKLFSAEAAGARAEYEAFPNSIEDGSDRKLQSQKKLVEDRYVSAQFAMTQCMMVEALCHQPGTDERADRLKAAASEFESLHRKYRTRLSGGYSRLLQGRCLQYLGDSEAATEIYSEFLGEAAKNYPAPDVPNLALQSYLSILNNNRRDWPTVIAEASEWFDGASAADRQSMAGAGILWEEARAMLGPNEQTPIRPARELMAIDDSPDLILRATVNVLLQVQQSENSHAGLAKRRIQDVLALIGDLEDDAPAEAGQSIYFQVPLPDLPTGTYTVGVSVDSPGQQAPATVGGRITVPASNATGAQLSLLARQAIIMQPITPPDGLEQMPQQPTGLDFKPILRSTGQLALVTSFPTGHVQFQQACAMLREQGMTWALCATLHHVNVDAKIYAARELKKLAAPDTVSVLLAAAKRNNFGVSGSESAALHSIYRRTLREALEAATGLKLTPSDMYFMTVRDGERVRVTSANNPEQFPEAVDFPGVEKWLRDVYLPGTAKRVAKLGSPVYDDTGLIGRATVDGQDARTLFHYSHGRFFSRDNLPVWFHDSNGFVVTLEGFVEVPRDMTVKVWLAGGGVSGDVNWLYVDGTEIGSTGDDRGKNYTYELPLLKGLHHIRWKLTGGTFRTNILVFLDPESGKLMRLVNAGEASFRKSPDEPLIRINSTETGWPVRDNWLPPVIEISDSEDFEGEGPPPVEPARRQ